MKENNDAQDYTCIARLATSRSCSASARRACAADRRARRLPAQFVESRTTRGVGARRWERSDIVRWNGTRRARRRAGAWRPEQQQAALDEVRELSAVETATSRRVRDQRQRSIDAQARIEARGLIESSDYQRRATVWLVVDETRSTSVLIDVRYYGWTLPHSGASVKWAYPLLKVLIYGDP